MKHIRLYASAAAVLIADQLSKRLWRDADFDLLPGVVAFHGTRNTGMAFGWLAGGTALLTVFGAAVCLGLLLYLRRKRLSRLCQYGAGLLLGGAAGNLLDRLLRGFVIDFIDPVFLHWFVCNIADIGITCGTALLVIHLLFGKEEKHP